MKLAAAMILACASSAMADEKVPDFVEPFLKDDANAAKVVTGDFGPAKDTTIVITWSVMGTMPFAGFALVPDVKKGHKKLALPSFGVSSLDGEVNEPLAINVDKDPENELVVGLHAQLSGGNYTYAGTVYVVLDYRGKKFVRMRALEKKLASAMTAREEDTTAPLPADQIKKLLTAR